VRRRLLGWGLVLYGLVGIALVVVGGTVGLEVAARVEGLATAAQGTLAAAARSVDAASDAFANVDSSLAESQTSAEAGATLARDASGTLASLSAAMELSIFGAQPLLPLAADFATSAEQAEALAVTLGRVASSLDDTRVDVSSIGDELDDLGTELAILRDSAGAGGDAPSVRPFVLLLLAWLLVPALGAVLGGMAVLGMRPR
jgi:hypothetical protein